MKINKLHIIVLITCMMSMGLSSCGLFGKADNSLVGRWEYVDYNSIISYSARFENNKNFYLKEEKQAIKNDSTFLSNKKFYGIYEIAEDIVSLHYTKIEYEEVVYINHEKTQTVKELPLYDEKAKYETDKYRHGLTLIRNYGTDSTYTQKYRKILYQ